MGGVDPFLPKHGISRPIFPLNLSLNALGRQRFFYFIQDRPGDAKAKCAAVKEEAEGRLRLLEREKADMVLERGQGPVRPKGGGWRVWGTPVPAST